MADLVITAGEHELEADWLAENHRTRDALLESLPVSGEAARWGDELYFDVPVDVDPAATRAEVPVGTIAYWPQGNALCLFWGPTPASIDGMPRAASPVAPLARIDDVSPLDATEGGAWVRVEIA
ncbi:cyclophilin-like fold protein [Halapricum hydrolyticum]|uniref:Cyclophilin-like fold protein n=1 Tax=Halapricum hydrolyticum TaxID=2979991 RepID=A0AAE3I966_9EURY|nr:cyclophilin-like fold protein [Halapricum hydrolyticum]MCU4717248.1 cyclophilin-like fold protein [Halapricum hydrolyticum]MCU4726175.1 cyclophilin-like fold protein [Halapricum hydrolyticum]